MNYPVQLNLDQRMDEFRRHCRAAGFALTHQREVIYRAVLESRSHPTPEAIYERVRRDIPSISLGTVYKNVKTFLDAGLLREVSPLHGSLRLEANLGVHHHLICMRCKTVVDIEESDIEPARLKGGAPDGFEVLRANVEFYGLCPACAGKTKEA
jgi:Fur family peroxide stress response transcriptional regulator